MCKELSKMGNVCGKAGGGACYKLLGISQPR